MSETSETSGKSGDDVRRCEICGALDAGIACDFGHAVCSLCYLAFVRANEKLAQTKVVCANADCIAFLPSDAKIASREETKFSRDVRLVKPTDELKEVTKAFSATMGTAVIVQIFRIENKALEYIFESCKARLKKKNVNKVCGVNEQLLFHGTSRAASGGIIREGFDMRRSGSAHGQVYGAGAYFAQDASLAHSYAKIDSAEQRCMLVCRVLLGDTADVDSKKAMARAFVVSREQQILPRFVVYYKTPDAPEIVVPTISP